MFFLKLDAWNKVHGHQNHFRDTNVFVVKENRSYSLILALLWLVHVDKLSVIPIRTSWVMNVSRLFLFSDAWWRSPNIALSNEMCRQLSAQSRTLVWRRHRLQHRPEPSLDLTLTQTDSRYSAAYIYISFLQLDVQLLLDAEARSVINTSLKYPAGLPPGQKCSVLSTV